MYCPNCGKLTSVEQKFCRSCGLSLQKVVESLTEQLPAIDLDKDLQDRKRKVDRWITITAASAISIVVLSVLWGIIYEIIIVKGEVLAGSIFLALIIGLILFASLSLYRERLSKASKRQLPHPGVLQAEDTAKLLPESLIESTPSVTEKTTELLAAEREETR